MTKNNSISPNKKLSMLQIEDSNVDALLIASMLKNIPNYQFDIHHAVSLQEARDRVNINSYDIILLDLTLPDSSGSETLNAIREEIPDSPIVVITGTDDEDYISQAIEYGAQDYLVKGQINLELLKRTILAAIYRKKADDALKKSEERFQLAVQGSSVGIWDWNIVNNEIYVSDRLLQLLGYEHKHELDNFDKLIAITHPDDKTLALKAVQKHFKKREPYKVEYRLKTKSEGYRWFLAKGQAIWDRHNDPIRMVGSIADINGSKEAENSVKENEERLRFALEYANDGFWDWDITCKTVYFSPRYETMLGYDADELEPTIDAWKNKIHPDDLPTVMDKIENHLNGNEEYFSSEHRINTKQGEWLWILARGRVVKYDQDNRPTRMVGTQTDITAQKHAEHLIRSNEERFKLAIEGVRDGLWDWQDIKQDEQYWSPRFKALLGYKENEIEGSYSNFLKFLHPEDLEQNKKALEDHFSKDTPFNIEYRLHLKSGEYHWFRAKGKSVRDSEGHPIRMIGSISDVTEYKKAQEERNIIEMQLRQSQKLESIGQLAAGVAHEINTPVQFVSDNIRFLNDAFSDLEELLKQYKQLLNPSNGDDQAIRHQISELIESIDLDYLLEEIPTAINQSAEGTSRISSIVKAMKEFSHPGSTEKELSDINKSIINTIAVSRNEWKYVAEIKTDFDPELPMIECLPGEFNQTILNLIVNAAHAITDTKQDDELGTIRISTKSFHDHIIVSISDTGIGIPEKIRAKIFDPFFTTKEVGKGTGQGLALAYKVIVDKHQGELLLDSTVGQGTTFTLKLPIKSDSSTGDIHHEKARAIC